MVNVEEKHGSNSQIANQCVYLVPTLPYCSASCGLEADVTKPSPYLLATFCDVLLLDVDVVPFVAPNDDAG